MAFKYDTPEHFERAGSHFLGWTPTPQEIITKQVAEAIANDREGKVRQALIDLGWTPPTDSAARSWEEHHGWDERG